MSNNGYFKYGDPYTLNLDGHQLHPSWWSRHYEYLWAASFTERDHICADMGCGWMARPFKDILAKRCDLVLAVDADDRLLELPSHDNMVKIVADITKDTGIEANGLDRVYCISVLEDLATHLTEVLTEFKRILKPDGLIVITTDVQHDFTRMLGQYPATNIHRLIEAVSAAGLAFDGAIDFDRTDAVYNDEFNLCCFHAVLRKA